MRNSWLIIVLMLSSLFSEFTSAQAPTPEIRKSSPLTSAIGAQTLRRLREIHRELFRNAKGVLVVGVTVGSQADAAGIHVSGGGTNDVSDILVSYAGQPIDTPESFIAKVKKFSSTTEAIELGLIRNRELLTIKMRPGFVGLLVMEVKNEEMQSTNRSAPEPSSSGNNEKSEIFIQLGHSKPVEAIAFSPDGHLFATGGEDNTVKLWDVTTKRELRTLQGDSNPMPVTSVAFSPDGKTIATASLGAIKIWDVVSGKMVRIRQGGSGNQVVYSPDGRYLISAGSVIAFWDADKHQRLRAIETSERTSTIAISPDGRLLASSDTKGIIKIWDVETGSEVRTLSGQTTTLASIAFSPDGHLIASGGIDSRIKLWDVASGNELRTIIDTSYASSGRIAVVFSPDGLQVITGVFSSDKSVKAWNVATGKEQRLFSHTGGFVGQALQFSPDGRILAAGGLGRAQDGSQRNILHWDFGSGEALTGMTSKIAVHYMGSRAFSPDGRMIAFGSKSSHCCPVKLKVESL